MSELDLGFDRAHGARIYNYMLGGKDNYPRDREAGDAAMKAYPGVPISMRANRAFMHRVVHFLAADRGITQFLDIGTGIPTAPNLHEIVQAVTPSARVVYTDNDPIVLAHARALLVGTPEGATAYVHADIRDPESIIDSVELRDTLDLSKPVALTVLAVVHFVEDDEVAYRVVRRLVDALPAGSCLAMSVGTADFDPERMENVRRVYQDRGQPCRLRTKAQIEAFFDGLELIEPGVVQVHRWHPDPVAVGSVNDADVAVYGGLAYKP
jgi:hypothetical protein